MPLILAFQIPTTLVPVPLVRAALFRQGLYVAKDILQLLVPLASADGRGRGPAGAVDARA